MSPESKPGMVIGKSASNFTLQAHTGGYISLKDEVWKSPVMLVFYPKDFTHVCTQQLCDYRDNIDGFKELGVKIFGISNNDRHSHSEFAKKHGFPFLLLSDPDNKVAKQYDCSSLFMLGNVSRAVFLLNRRQQILYRYIEPTILTRRKSHELLQVIQQLRDDDII